MLRSFCLDDLCEKISDGSHNPPKQVEYSKYIMLSSKNILDNKITFDNPRYLSEQDFFVENKRTNIEVGDVLLTIVGTVGRCTVVEKLDRKITFQRSVAVLTPKKDLILSKYLMFFLQSISYHLNKKARGVAQKGIYLKSIRNILIDLPPLSEQQLIVAKIQAAFSEVDKLITHQKERKYQHQIVISKMQNNLFEESRSSTKNVPLGEVVIFENGDRGKNYTSKKYQIDAGIAFVNA